MCILYTGEGVKLREVEVDIFFLDLGWVALGKPRERSNGESIGLSSQEIKP